MPTTSELLFHEAMSMGLQPTWITHPGGIFGVQIGGKEQYVNFAHSPFNSQSAASLAKNKYATRCLLERHELNNVPFLRTTSHEEATAFLDRNGTIVAKPVKGSGSKDIHIIQDSAALKPLNLRRYILEKYIVGQEYRYLVLNDKVIAVHRSEYGVSVASDRYLQRIAYASKEWDESLCSTSLHALHILGLKFAAVDFIIDAAGTAHLLEINSAPGLKWFHSPTSGSAVNVATLFLQAMLDNDQPVSEHLAAQCDACDKFATKRPMVSRAS